MPGTLREIQKPGLPHCSRRFVFYTTRSSRAEADVYGIGAQRRGLHSFAASRLTVRRLQELRRGESANLELNRNLFRSTICTVIFLCSPIERRCIDRFLFFAQIGCVSEEAGYGYAVSNHSIDADRIYRRGQVAAELSSIGGKKNFVVAGGANAPLDLLLPPDP